MLEWVKCSYSLSKLLIEQNHLFHCLMEILSRASVIFKQNWNEQFDDSNDIRGHNLLLNGWLNLFHLVVNTFRTMMCIVFFLYCTWWSHNRLSLSSHNIFYVYYWLWLLLYTVYYNTCLGDVTINSRSMSNFPSFLLVTILEGWELHRCW